MIEPVFRAQGTNSFQCCALFPDLLRKLSKVQLFQCTHRAVAYSWLSGGRSMQHHPERALEHLRLANVLNLPHETV